MSVHLPPLPTARTWGRLKREDAPSRAHRMGAGGSCSFSSGPRERTGQMETGTAGLSGKPLAGPITTQRKTEAGKEIPIDPTLPKEI